jgi:hypothetical protein
MRPRLLAPMKFVQPRPFAAPDIAARKLAEIANGVEAVQDGPRLKRLHVSKSGAFRLWPTLEGGVSSSRSLMSAAFSISRAA